jgi:MoaA/NifB/PqqE/SkfB family radical SAM enzyme
MERMNGDPRNRYREMVLRSARRLERLNWARPLKTGRVREMILDVTMECGQGCPSCYARRSGSTMDRQLLSRLIGYVEANMLTGIFVGGEPLGCLDMIVELTKDKTDVHFVIVTNGEALDAASAKTIGEAGNLFVILSLDGIGEVNDASRSAGSFGRILNGIALLQEYRVPFGINTVATSHNLEQILSGELAAFIDRAGACTWEIFRYYPVGTASVHYDQLMLSGTGHIQLKRYRQALAANNPYGFSYAFAENDKRRCQRAFKVNVDGTVTYCPFSAWWLTRIDASDTDDEITGKFLSRQTEWTELGRSANGFCPLFTHTRGYIGFFENYGHQAFPPTGILDPKSQIHQQFTSLNRA